LIRALHESDLCWRNAISTPDASTDASGKDNDGTAALTRTALRKVSELAVNRTPCKEYARLAKACVVWFALGLAGSTWIGTADAQEQAPVPMEDLQPMESSEPELPEPAPPVVQPPKVQAPKAAEPTTAKRPSNGLIINLDEDGDQPTPAAQPEPVPKSKAAPEPVQVPTPPVATPAPRATAPAAPAPAPAVTAPTPPVEQPPAAPLKPPKTTPLTGLPQAPSPAATGTPVSVGAAVGVVAVTVLGALLFWLVSRQRKPSAKGTDEKPREAEKEREAQGSDIKEPRSTPGRRPAVLRDISSATDEPEHEIIADTVQIGRATAQSDDIQSIVVKMNTVGRRHAVIEYRHHTYWLVDQGSLNGTFLNGERIHKERALNNGAHIQLESAEFEFGIPEVQVRGAAATADPGEFIETLIASEAQADAMTDAAKAEQDMRGAETVIDMTPQEGGPDAAQQPKLGSGTVDFDIFGGDDSAPKSGQ
jgi:hypothetical protein